MQQAGKLGMTGRLSMRITRIPKAPLSWRLRNWLRWAYIWGLLTNTLAKVFSRVTGIPTFTGELRARYRSADGRWVDLGVLSRRVVTTAAAQFIVDAFDNKATDPSTWNYHAVGTGTGDEAVGDTTLGTEIESRATGTKTQPTAVQLQTEATITFTGSHAVTEHGVFSATPSGGTLLDRSKFAAWNVGSGDQVTYTYILSVNAGG